MDKSVEQLVDFYLEKMGETPVFMQHVDTKVPNDMLDTSRQADNDWVFWKAIESTITDSDIESLEKQIKLKFPPSYKAFLKNKYFIQLIISDHAVNFPIHSSREKFDGLKELIYNYSNLKRMRRKGLIYFADFHDYGLLCFDTKRPDQHGEYPIVYLDHENLKIRYDYTESFAKLLEGDENYGNRFIEKMNE